ncbi:MAG: aspartate 4-decarboxylase [Peptostreptococcaceae bacterium]
MKKVDKNELQSLYGKISPFEFKDRLIKIAKMNSKNILDAGRGNPNWISTTPREAFFTFGQFAVTESKRDWEDVDLGGMPQIDGIYFRFCEFIKNNPNLGGIDLLDKMINYAIIELGFDPDKWMFELTDAIIGDNYPVPDRMLVHIEKAVKKYLIQELKYDVKNGNDFDVFAVEGATAAMCYTFDSLIANNLLLKGDNIAIMIPTFTPYLEIPHLPRYEFEVTYINANKDDGQYNQDELDKLKNKDIKALFVVNPSNPRSIAISSSSIDYLSEIVKNDNPDLMIISDDVYGTFVDNFESLMAKLPFNTIGSYSYSKYFGVTGWRLGTIALHKENVFDKLINDLPYSIRKRTHKRYQDMNLEPSSVKFIDRIVADSRQVALNHTAGLSTPQQVQMAFFSLFAILDSEHNYKNLTINICKNRKKLLYDGLEIENINSSLDACYYTDINFLDLCEMKYKEDFRNYVEKNITPFDILFELAKTYSIVLLSGSGFAGCEWSFRVSLANLKNESYLKIGQCVSNLIDKYKNDFDESLKGRRHNFTNLNSIEQNSK